MKIRDRHGGAYQYIQKKYPNIKKKKKTPSNKQHA